MQFPTRLSKLIAQISIKN